MKTIEDHEIQSRPPGRPRDEDARDRIRDATISLLEEVGFANLTCNAIALRAGTRAAIDPISTIATIAPISTTGS